jgi:hypothetical protein
VINPQFGWADSFSDGLAQVRQDGTGYVGYTDRSGAYVWGPFSYGGTEPDRPMPSGVAGGRPTSEVREFR